MDGLDSALAVAAAAVLLIAGAAVLAPKLRIPAPLLLVVVGVAVGFLLPVTPPSVPPEAVLVGVLPPLLYAASVSVPSMNLRREFGAVSGLSVVLVVVTALVLGWVLSLLVPGLDYRWAVALAAVISPTDAVATTIVKQAGVSSRVTAILEGESLLNDATALVVLATAVGGAATLLGVVGSFAWSIVLAVLAGLVVGKLSVRVRARIAVPAIGTAVSFTVPFAVSLPVEALHGSGLVAAVVAGLVVGRDAPRRLSAQSRMSDQQNWGTVSVVLEGAVFLLMGLELPGILRNASGSAVGGAVGVAALALLVTLLIRAVFVGPLLGWLGLRARRGTSMRDRLHEMQAAAAAGDTANLPRIGLRRTPRPIDLQRFAQRVQQVLADIDYLAASPLGVKEGTIVVWAGLRGAVTVAAAQTLTAKPADGLPAALLDTLVLIAFAAAALSLVLQGGTLALLVRVLKPRGNDEAQLAREGDEVVALMRRTAEELPEEPGQGPKDRRLAQLHAQRNMLLDARDLGTYDAEVLGSALAVVDAAEITTDMLGGAPGGEQRFVEGASGARRGGDDRDG